MNYQKFTSASDLFNSYNKSKKLSQSIGEKKSIILNFSTHDDVSPMLVNSNYPTQLLWLAATLPGNMYFVNGFLTGDFYNYSYANKPANVSYTDNESYYVHKGKLDIFNFSRRAGGTQLGLSRQFELASNFKGMFVQLFEKNPKILKTSNQNIFAYEYRDDKNRVIVILNHNLEFSVQFSH